jgi:hypothetical protein
MFSDDHSFPPGIYLIHEGKTPPFEYTYRHGFHLIRLQDYRHYTTIISSRLPGLAYNCERDFRICRL